MVWTNDPDDEISVCNQAASSCCETADDIKIIVNNLIWSYNQTVGLYDECKCDFWLHICQDFGKGEACDYAAEYCCGDYLYYEGREIFSYLNIPLCYCDFFNFAESNLGYTLKPKALKISKEFSNPCIQGLWGSSGAEQVEQLWRYEEKQSLKAMYEKTSGHSWRNNALL
ncbi:hypothetical protein ACHAXM_000171 [Skeletonema potamos]|jgi:hypothetical protein